MIIVPLTNNNLVVLIPFNKIKLLMSKSPKHSEMSTFEKLFSTQQTFKRNKRYLDILKLNQQEQLHSQRRRKPLQDQSYADQKIKQAFSSSKKELHSKLDQDIQNYRFRMSMSNAIYQDSNAQTNETTNHMQSSGRKSVSPTISSPNKIKGVSMQKLLSRQHLDQISNKVVEDERMFNNFSLTKHNLDRTPKLQNYSQRDLNFSLQHINDLYHDTQKSFQDNYYSNTTTSCLFKLKVQKDTHGRYFFPQRKIIHDPSTDLNPENVAKSFHVATPFKPNKISHFYKIHGRDLPCQLDARMLSPNQNFYKNKKGKLIRAKQDFTSRKYKDQLLVRDIEELRKAKRPYFNRDEICDERYFRQESKI